MKGPPGYKGKGGSTARLLMGVIFLLIIILVLVWGYMIKIELWYHATLMGLLITGFLVWFVKTERK